ncbi:hypothetical protein DPMN_156057 [Dreissena polymorpha]|uniref:Uncharacterized protein n=1 Tax=Dreissena polymorpha TaxID=45954 RepID=A0A9D4FQJ0_DREPO|nr:hypothetical protein DPMN_156057 [Dreissena polymorpha]
MNEMENEEINFMFSDIFDFEDYFNENTENLNETSSLAEKQQQQYQQQQYQQQQKYQQHCYP